MSKIRPEKINYGSAVLIKLPDTKAQSFYDEPQGFQSPVNEVVSRAELEARGIIERAMAEAQRIAEQAEDEGHKIVDTARAEAKRIEAQALALADIARLKGEHEGFQKGYEDGAAQVGYELSEKVRAVDLFAASNFEIKNKILKSAQKDVMELCIAICRKICHKTLDGKVVLKIVERALTLLETPKEDEKINILISPYLAELLGTLADGNKSLNIITSPKIAQDAIIVETLADRIDCSINSQIDEIANAFLDELGKIQID